MPVIVSMGYAGNFQKIGQKTKVSEKNHFHEKLFQRSYQGAYPGEIKTNIIIPRIIGVQRKAIKKTSRIKLFT